jgi:hypothetical protein
VRVEEPDDCEHTAMVVACLGKPKVGEGATHVLLDSSLRDPEATSYAGVGATFSHQREHVALGEARSGSFLR